MAYCSQIFNDSEGLPEPTTVGSLDEKSKGYRLMLLYRLGSLEIFPIKVDWTFCLVPEEKTSLTSQIRLTLQYLFIISL